MNVFHSVPVTPHVVLATCGGPRPDGRRPRRSSGFHLREWGWVTVGLLLGATLCHVVVAPALTSVSVPPAGLGSLAVFGMLLASVRDRPGVQPVGGRLASAIRFAPAVVATRRNAS